MPRTARIGILDFGRIRARIKGPDPREEQALATYEQTVPSSFEDVENALVAYPATDSCLLPEYFGNVMKPIQRVSKPFGYSDEARVGPK